MAKVKSKVDEEPTSCFTSMIDIVFLLLIFFILQPFKAPEVKLRSELPKDSGPSSTPDAPKQHIRLMIKAIPGNKNDARFMIDDITPPPASAGGGDQIYKALEKRRGGNSQEAKETPIAIMPDLTVHFTHVLKALDQCYKAEMPNVKFEGPPLKGYTPGK